MLPKQYPTECCLHKRKYIFLQNVILINRWMSAICLGWVSFWNSVPGIATIFKFHFCKYLELQHLTFGKMVIYLWERNQFIYTCSISHGVWLLLGFSPYNILVSLWDIPENTETCSWLPPSSRSKYLLNTPCLGVIYLDLRFINISGTRTLFDIAMAFWCPGITPQKTNSLVYVILGTTVEFVVSG